MQLLKTETREIENDIENSELFFFEELTGFCTWVTSYPPVCFYNVPSAFSKVYETNLVLTKHMAVIIKMTILLKTKYLTATGLEPKTT